MILSPNLDDRTYQDIVDEAIRLIPHYCPEWTNHNPTDPGITMIELFAWMMEMVIYRLNQVPDKNYLALLDLIGLSMTPPQPARVLLTFNPVEGYHGEINVRKGTQVSTKKDEITDAVIFETERSLIVSDIEMEACFSTENGLISDNMIPYNTLEKVGFNLFSGRDEIERYVYISDDSFGFLKDTNSINVFFKNKNEIKTLNDEIVNFFDWEYWNGKKWIPFETSRSISGRKKKDNEIYFSGPIPIEKISVNGKEGFFLRGILSRIPLRPASFEIEDIRSRLVFTGQGLAPDILICNNDNMVFTEIDISKEFTPFVGVPKYNDSLYIASEEVFSKAGSAVFLTFRLSDAQSVDKPEANEELLLKWEYWNGKNWAEIGTTTKDGVSKMQGDFSFKDTTKAMTVNGVVSFLIPEDMIKSKINGLEMFWIRVRIGAGDFGLGGEFEMDESGKWGWKHNRPVKPPVLSSIFIKYEAIQKPVNNVLSYYDFAFCDFSEENASNYLQSFEDNPVQEDFFTLFRINRDKLPITYFGFNRAFPSGNNGIYFRIDERKRVMPERSVLPVDSIAQRINKSKRSIILRWEYWNGNSWGNLPVNDFTDSFHESGFVEFMSPEDMTAKDEFGKGLFWVRLVLESGSFEFSPRIISIDLNSVCALNQQTHENEILGTGSGSPSQEYRFLHVPLLPGAEIWVRENEIPPSIEKDIIVKDSGDSAIDLSNGEVWIRYKQVENFYNSNQRSRHYCLDFSENKIIFGDGKNGVIPPKIKNNIAARKYVTGGGAKGNVGHSTVVLLRENIPFIASVTNTYSAEGGSDLENITSLKSRATNVFKGITRAVTAEDYEWLAFEASASVARAKCMSKLGKDGEILVVIVPRPDFEAYDLKKDLYPSTELKRRVRDFLNSRKLVGTKLRVDGPNYVRISLNIKIVFRKEVSEVQTVKDRIELSVRRFLHPVTGGAKGEGWGFGVPLAKNDIFFVLDKIDGIHYVEEIEIVDEAAGVSVEKRMLEEDNLLAVTRINIIERKNQY